MSVEEATVRTIAADVGLRLVPSSYSAVAKSAQFICDKGHTTEKKVSNVINNLHSCVLCSFRVSAANIEISEVVKNLGFDVELEKKFPGTNKSVDVFVPSAALAIDYHGNIWHSSRYISDSNRHAASLKLAESAGWTYIQVFSDEWLNRKPQVTSRLAHMLGKSLGKVFARKCEVVEVSYSEAAQFHNTHHVQGASLQGNLHMALRHEGVLVSVISVGAHMSRRGVKSLDCLELLRYSTSTSVVGGLSRLIAALRNQHSGKTLVTYCDRHMFSGGAYEKVGFALAGITRPDYTYITAGDQTRRHKSGFQKSRLAKKYGVSTEGKTEAQITHELGLYRVYDCGKSRWTLTL